MNYKLSSEVFLVNIRTLKKLPKKLFLNKTKINPFIYQDIKISVVYLRKGLGRSSQKKP